MAVSTIDLGNVSDRPADDDPLAEPSGGPDRWVAGRSAGWGQWWIPRWWRQQWWRRPVRRRTAGAAAVAVLLGATLVAAAPPSTGALTPVFTVPAGSGVLLDADTLYVHHHGSGATELAAYRLADGTEKWRVADQRNAGGAHLSWVQVRQGVPLVTTFDETGRLGNRPAQRTVAHDPETGQVRWIREGDVTASAPGGPGGVVVLLVGPVASADGATGQVLTAPVAVDLVSGEVVWSGPPAARWGYGFHRPDQERYLVSLDERGLMTSYDVGTGAVLATTDMTAVGDPRQAYAYVAGQMVFVHEQTLGTFHAYDAGTLAHRWSSGDAWLAADCGPVLCVQAGDGMRAVSPFTGAVRWSAGQGSDRGGGFGASWPHSLGPGFDGTLLVGGRLVDAVTGDELLSLRPWQMVSDSTIWVPGAYLDPVLMWRQPGDADDGPRTWFARLRPDPAGIEVLGSTGRLDGCRSTADRLVCRDGREWHVWRLP
jgi:hypothetical protein